MKTSFISGSIILKPKYAGILERAVIVCLFGGLVASSATPPDPSPDGLSRQRMVEQMRIKSHRAELEFDKRAYPIGQIPSGAMARALFQTQQATAKNIPRLNSVQGFSFWYSLGPAPINSTQDNKFEPASGRVPVVAVDPLDPKHWLIGAAQGGIWSTVNSGSTWIPRTDAQASLAMGAITFAPSAPRLVYAGTGEANFSWDSYAGQGLLVSLDGGFNWQMRNTNFAETSFSSIKVDPNNTNRLTVATTRGVAGKVSRGVDIPPAAPPRGVFLSTDGGTNFTRTLTGETTDLQVDLSNFQHQYAGLGEIYGAPANGVYRSLTGGSSWQIITGPWSSADPTDLGRIALAIAPSQPDTVYVAIARPRDSSLGEFFGIWRTDNAWASPPVWIQLPTIDNGPFLWYSFSLSVNPTDPGTLYFAGFKVQRFKNNVWTSVSDGIHVDNHAMAWVPFGFNPSTYKLLLGNDGGVWLSQTPFPTVSSWDDLNHNLEISQIYKGAVSPLPKSALALAGIQDNGAAVNNGQLAWQAFFPGDGGDNAISSSDPSQSWAFSEQTGTAKINIFRTLQGGNSPENVTAGMDTANAPFLVHFEKSPRNDDLFIAGTVQLWRCTNFFSGTVPLWYSNGPTMFDTNSEPVPLSAMAFAPSDLNGLIYAYGTEDGQLRITTNGGNAWQNLDPTNAVPQRYISGLAFSPANSNVLYVTLSGFDEGTPSQPGHLFKTTNALAATPFWSNVSPPVNLPNNCLVIHPSSPDTIFVGCDVGVWCTANGGGSWIHYGPSSGMPNVAVFDLRMDSAGNPTAFTHGRSAFALKPGIPVININYGAGGLISPGCITCSPVFWINPGDRVSIDFPLQNILPIDTVNLVATLLASPQITPITTSQTYGVVPGQGPPVSRTFAFQANFPPGTSCGDTFQATLQLMDGTNDLGEISVPFRIGSPRSPLHEDFAQVSPSGLPIGWATSASGTDVAWSIVTNAPPNDPLGEPEDPDAPSDAIGFGAPPTPKAFAPASLGFGQASLTTPSFLVVTPRAQLSFRQAYLAVNRFDGCVLEIAIGTGGFQDILASGGSFVRLGYDVTLDDHNPLGPRRAWSGDSGGWLPVLVNLPSSAAGQMVQLRWRFATFAGVPDGGWFIDSVNVTEPQCLPPVTNPMILEPRLSGASFTFDLDTVSTRTYLVEYKTNLSDPLWQILQTLSGNGTRQTISLPVNGSLQAYFRFRVQ